MSGRRFSVRNWFPAAIAAVLLSSCVGGAFYFGAYTPVDYTPKEKQEYGVLLASVGMADSLRDDNYGYAMEFRRKGQSGGVVGAFGYPPAAGRSLQPRKIELEEGKRHGIVIAFPLVPGEYEISRYVVAFSTGTGFRYVPWASKEGFSIPFSIVAGRTTYLGQIMLDPQERADALAGIMKSLDSKGIFAVSDQLARDMVLAEEAGRPVTRTNPLKEIPDLTEPGLSDFRKDNP
jgi:hypothetical protein